MFRYYNYTLIESNRSYSTEKIQKLLGINPQTIRAWIKEHNIECVSKKPILIYGATLKVFIKARNKKHKKSLGFKEMKCLKCRGIDIPKNNQVSIHYTKQGGVRVVGICSNCDNKISKLYKKNSINELKSSFSIKSIELTLYNTSPTNNKTHLSGQNKTRANESQPNSKQLLGKKNISTKTHIAEQK